MRQCELGGDWGYAQGPGGVPPLGSATDHRDGGKTRSRQRAVVPLGSGGNVNRGDPPHQGVYQEVKGDHIRNGGMISHI